MIRGASKIYPILCNNRYHLTKYTSGKSPLSTSSVLRLVSGRSPTVKDIEHRKKWELQNHDPSKSAPTPVPRPARQEKPDSPCPNALFVSAHLSGVLPVNPETAGRILNDFQSLDGNPGPKALEELCSSTHNPLPNLITRRLTPIRIPDTALYPNLAGPDYSP